MYSPVKSTLPAIASRCLSGNRFLGILILCLFALAAHPSLGGVVALQAGPCAPVPSGMVGWWAGEGDTADRAFGNTGIPTSISYAAGEVGSAFSFNGTSSSIRIPASGPLNVGTGPGFTIEAWINPTDAGNGHPIAEWSPQTSGLAYGTHFWIGHPSLPPGYFYANIVDTSGGFHVIDTDPGLIVAGSFQHVAVTYDKASGTARLYLNGTIVRELNLGTFTPQTSYDLYLGRRPPGDVNSKLFSGLIDEVGVYSRALSSSEILDTYNAGSSGKCLTAPVVTLQPTNMTVITGSNATFVANGIGTPQWTFFGTNLPGANSLSYTVTNALPRHAGSYSVILTNSSGSATSSPASLKVIVAAAFANSALLSSNQYTFAGFVDVTLQNYFPGGSLFYTVDGSTPTVSSQAYSSPIRITQNSNLRFLAYSANFANFAEADPIAFTITVPPCLTAPSGLVGWWPGQSDGVDLLGSNPGFLTNISFGPGVVGNGFNLNGVNSTVRIPASPTLDVGSGSGFTVEAWINPTDAGNGHPIVEWSPTPWGPSYGVHLWLGHPSHAPGYMYANIADTSGNFHVVETADGVLRTNQFQHVALTYDKTTGRARLFVNGNMVAQTSLGTFRPQTTFDLNIGRRPTGDANSRLFAGIIDEVSLYNRELSSNEIMAIATAFSSGKCPLQIPPTLTLQPTNKTVTAGATATFVAGVSGSPTLALQWRLNGTNVAGATNASLTLTNLLPRQAGSYALFVTNAYGSITSAPANLKILALAVSANGQPLTTNRYQFLGSASITMQDYFANGSIFYTLDGSAPNFSSTHYTGAFQVTQNSILRAIAYSADFQDFGEVDPITLSLIPTYTLSKSTLGGGSIGLNPSSGPYTNGATVTATASPSAGWSFLYWQGDATATNLSIPVLMTRDKRLQAVFGTTLGTTVAGNGSVAVVPASALYPYGATVRITATPQAGNYFGVWGNAASGNINPLSFTITNANPVVSSIFAALGGGQSSLSLSAVGSGKVTANPQANVYSTSAFVTVTATPDTNQVFLGWSGDAAGTQNPLSFQMDQSRIITANFSRRATLGGQGTAAQIALDGFRLLITGDVGAHYEIDASTDSLTWTNLATVTNKFGTVQYDDLGATNLPYRFYRAIVAP